MASKASPAQPAPGRWRVRRQPQAHLEHGRLAGPDLEPSTTHAALVPFSAGLTVAAPFTTWSLMPSFG